METGIGQDVYTPPPWKVEYDKLMESGKSGKYRDVLKAQELYKKHTEGMTEEEILKMMFTNSRDLK